MLGTQPGVQGHAAGDRALCRRRRAAAPPHALATGACASGLSTDLTMNS